MNRKWLTVAVATAFLSAVSAATPEQSHSPAHTAAVQAA